MYGRPNEASLDRAMHRLAHRGPDGRGYWLDPLRRIGLAHTRLSIIDLPGGGQPIFNEDRSVAVVFNGEIYNFVELREDLTARGHTFATQTDTEVLVHLYEERGEDLVEPLRGMFALALWDDRRGRLLLARDRVGKKPLYYAAVRDGLMFASEIKGLRALGVGPLTIEDQAMSDYLTFGHVPSPATIYREVRALPPAHILVTDGPPDIRLRRYWQWPSPVEDCPENPTPTDVVAAADRVEQVLADAVRLRLRADVPVGVFLSGGIDSGLIVALAAEASDRPVVTLSAGFETASFDERALARRVARRYGSAHHELVVRPDPHRLLPRIVEAYDQPYADSSAIPSYALAELARQHVKVVLNGDGGDEVFAGYRRYVAARLVDRLGPLRWNAAQSLWRLADLLLPDPQGFRTGYAFVRRLIRGMALPGPERILAWGNDGLDERTKRQIAGSRADWLDACRPTWQPIAERLDCALAPTRTLDRQMWIDAQTLLPDDLLVKMDIATMAHGLEARSPLLDHLLIETVARWPGRAKLPGRMTKPLLRLLAERYLPPDVVTAPKRGFEVPLTRWLQHELRGLRDELLLDPTGLMAERFDRQALAELIRRPRVPDPARWARWVWTLMVLALWDRHRCRQDAP